MSSRPLRVFLLIANPTWSGVTRLLAALVPHVDRSRIEMRVVNMADESRAYPIWDRCGVSYYRLPTPGRCLVPAVWRLARLLRRERPDVLEIYGLRANLIGRLSARLAGVPVVLTGVVSTDDWRKWYHVWLDRLTRWAVTRWVCNAEACKRSVVERERHPADRVDVIYDAIETNLWSPVRDASWRAALRRQWGWPDDAVVGVTVAVMRPDKGLQYLIEAAPGVVRAVPQARFLLVGMDEMEGRLHQKAREAGMEGIIAFAGFQDDLKKLYAACDLAVLPSLREGLPLFLVEAMCMQLPVVATNVGGIPELVSAPQSGLLVPPRDAGALAEALAAVMGDAQRREAMGRAARDRALRTFRIERMVEDRQRYYEQVAGLARSR